MSREHYTLGSTVIFKILAATKQNFEFVIKKILKSKKDLNFRSQALKKNFKKLDKILCNLNI